MKNSRVLTAVLVIILVLLAINVASRLLSTQQTASAKDSFQYKVASGDDIAGPDQYEKLLNDMSKKGWTFDHIASITGWIVFRK